MTKKQIKEFDEFTDKECKEYVKKRKNSFLLKADKVILLQNRNAKIFNERGFKKDRNELRAAGRYEVRMRSVLLPQSVTDLLVC